MRRCDELLRAGQTDETHQAIVGRSLAVLSAMAGRFDDTRELLERTEPVLERYDELVYSWVYLVIVGEAKELIGDRAGAEEALIAKWQWFRDLGDFPVDGRAMHAAYLLALLYCDEGRWDDAERFLAFGDQIPVPSYFLHEAVLGLAARARVAAYRGDLERGVALGRQAVALAEQSDFLNLQATTWLALGEALRRAGDEQGADAAVGTALDRYSTKGNVAAAARLLDSPTTPLG
jgi:tetratricopeptide (TPR) repeat protein